MLILPEKLYLVLKWTAALAIPVITFLSGILTSTLPSEKAATVISIITAVIGGLGTLAGVILKISDNNYYLLEEVEEEEEESTEEMEESAEDREE